MGFEVHRGTLFQPGRTLNVLDHARRVADVAIRRWGPDVVVRLFSGGHDSYCACHVSAGIAEQRGVYSPVVHINTGIGIEDTRTFVRDRCRDHGWELIEVRAREDCGQDYDEIVLEHGFPGPFMHRKMYNRLKERGLRHVRRILADRGFTNPLFVSGVRKAESTRRMGTAKTFNRVEGRLWAAPLIEWEGVHKGRYMALHGLPRNPVVDHLHMSGECLCGAFASEGELEWIEACGYTDVVERIRALEARAAVAGVPCQWGRRPPEPVDPDQIDVGGPLCHGCDTRIFDREAA